MLNRPTLTMKGQNPMGNIEEGHGISYQHAEPPCADTVNKPLIKSSNILFFAYISLKLCQSKRLRFSDTEFHRHSIEGLIAISAFLHASTPISFFAIFKHKVNKPQLQRFFTETESLSGKKSY